MSASESLHEQVKKYVNVPQNFVVYEEYFLKWNCFVSYQLQFQPLLPTPAYTKMEKNYLKSFLTCSPYPKENY